MFPAAPPNFVTETLPYFITPALQDAGVRIGNDQVLPPRRDPAVVGGKRKVVDDLAVVGAEEGDLPLRGNSDEQEASAAAGADVAERTGEHALDALAVELHRSNRHGGRRASLGRTEALKIRR